MKSFPLLSIVAVCASGAAFAQVENPSRPPVPADPRDRIPAGYTDGAMPAPDLPDGFTVINGLVYSIHHGIMAPLQSELVIRISPSGTITAFDGRTYPIPQGRVLTLVAAATPMPSGNGTRVGAEASAPGTGVTPGSKPGGRNSSIGDLNSSAGGGNDFPFFVVPTGAGGILGVTGAGTGLGPQATGNPQAPGTGISGQPTPNAANQPLSPTATGNQQNTTGTQQIPAGQGNAPGTGNAPGNATGTGRTNPPSGTAPGRTGTTGGATGGAPGATGGGAGPGARK